VAYRDYNRDAWSYLSKTQEASTVPFGPSEMESAAYWLDPYDWIPWAQVQTVLCLASGGGQQSLLFASLGREVTVYDLNPEQLATDKATAAEHGLTVETVEGDMMNLRALRGRHFDLVYQPISIQYVPSVEKVYRQVYGVTRPGGHYWVEHWNPTQMQLDDEVPWDGAAYRVTRPYGTGEPVAWEHAENGESAVSWNYIHPLSTLVGGLCDAGFVIRHFDDRRDGDLAAAPGSNEHLSAYIPSFLSMFARRPPETGRAKATKAKGATRG
jgi:SAM-dependent methyltransferase